MPCRDLLSLTAADVVALIATQQRSGRHVEEAFFYRNYPQRSKFGQLLAQGAIGTPRAVQRTFAWQCLDPNDIPNDPERGGGALNDIGSYTVS